MFKNFLKKIFSSRTVNIIVGTCICIILILVTLAIIEAAIFTRDSSRSRSRNFADMIVSKEKTEYKVLSVDTLQGDIFSFKDYIVLPCMEVRNTTEGKEEVILNFNLFDKNTEMMHTLFQSDRRVYESKLVKTEKCLLWLIETYDKHFYLYNDRADHLLTVDIPEDFYILYPKTIEDTIGEKSEKELELSDEKTAHVVNSICQPFSIHGNKMLISAQSHNGDKRYWLYNLNTYEIKLLTGAGS